MAVEGAYIQHAMYPHSFIEQFCLANWILLGVE